MSCIIYHNKPSGGLHLAPLCLFHLLDSVSTGEIMIFLGAEIKFQLVVPIELMVIINGCIVEISMPGLLQNNTIQQKQPNKKNQQLPNQFYQ